MYKLSFNEASKSWIIIYIYVYVYVYVSGLVGSAYPIYHHSSSLDDLIYIGGFTN